MQTILLTGGTGMISKTLVPLLISKGYKVIVLLRNQEVDKPFAEAEYAYWDVEKKEIDIEAVKRSDFIIHLAGANVMGQRWTKKYKQIIVDSRVNSAELLVQTIKQNKTEVKAIVSASAIGWYGEDKHAGKAFTENDPHAKDFLGETCYAWEEAIKQAEDANIRVCCIRTGIVLDANGGALAEFEKPAKMGFATILGSGKQVISWIHVADHCRIILQALTHSEMKGSYNSVAPEPVSNKVLVTTVCKILKGNFFIKMPVPTFALKLMLGERSIEILKSCTVSAAKIKETGFTFLYPTLSAALHQILSKK